MIEFNVWFFVLLANFLILLLILNSLLFQPLRKIFKERETTVKGALDEAKEMIARKDSAIATLNSEFAAARAEAKKVYNGLREEGLAKQRDTLSKAEGEAVAMIEKGRKELQAETEKARAALRADIDRFSEEIVRKLVKA